MEINFYVLKIRVNNNYSSSGLHSYRGRDMLVLPSLKIQFLSFYFNIVHLHMQVNLG